MSLAGCATYFKSQCLTVEIGLALPCTTRKHFKSYLIFTVGNCHDVSERASWILPSGFRAGFSMALRIIPPHSHAVHTCILSLSLQDPVIPEPFHSYPSPNHTTQHSIFLPRCFRSLHPPRPPGSTVPSTSETLLEARICIRIRNAGSEQTHEVMRGNALRSNVMEGREKEWGWMYLEFGIGERWLGAGM